MKVLSHSTSQNPKISGFNNPVLAFFLLSLMLVSLFILLTACDGRNSTAVPTATVAATPTQPAATSAASTQAATAAPVAPATTAAPVSPTTLPTAPVGQTGSISTLTEPTATAAVYGRPAISFSPELARIGDSVEISGTGYPATTRLNILIATADYKTLKTYDTVLTDADGNFKTVLKLEGEAQGSYLTPGKLEIAVTTPDGRVGASAPLALQAASNVSNDEACINLVREFFATMKRDALSAQIYLSSGLRSQLTPDKKSLPAFLGLEVQPYRVEITKVDGTKNSYKTTMYFADGTQKVVVMDVTNDTSGALKIAKVAMK